MSSAVMFDAVLGPQQVLQQHLEAVREARDVDALAAHRIEAVDLVGLTVHLERALRAETVHRRALGAHSLRLLRRLS